MLCIKYWKKVGVYKKKHYRSGRTRTGNNSGERDDGKRYARVVKDEAKVKTDGYK